MLAAALSDPLQIGIRFLPQSFTPWVTGFHSLSVDPLRVCRPNGRRNSSPWGLPGSAVARCVRGRVLPVPRRAYVLLTHDEFPRVPTRIRPISRFGRLSLNEALNGSSLSLTLSSLPLALTATFTASSLSGLLPQLHTSHLRRTHVRHGDRSAG